MSAHSPVFKRFPSPRSSYFLAAASLSLACTTLLHAQTTVPSEQEVLPSIGQSTGFTGTTSAPSDLQPDTSPYAHTDTPHGSGPSHHPQTAAAPFRIPRSITKTTANGTKFQFTLPRVGFRAGDAQAGRISPLDSSGTQPMGSRNTNFPTDNNFLQPTDTSSDNMFGSSADNLTQMPRGSHGGGGKGGGPGGSGGAAGPGLNVKSSLLDLHVGLSMKDMMLGGSSQNGGNGNSAGAAAPTDFSTTGGIHTPGSEGHGGGGAGARLSLGLRF